MEGALARAAAYAEAGADLLMLMHRNEAEFDAVSAGTALPLAAMTIGPGRTKEAMRAAGYALEVDPMSATVLGFRALQAGYEGIRDRTGFGMTREEVMAVIHEVGETIGIDALYAIEERTTERR
jgi:2-methylisocitrate lyase-like PEP mutase family enzyme